MNLLHQILQFFTENKRAHWPRIIYPAIVCAIVIVREDLYVKYTFNRPVEIGALSLISGGLFYFLYYFFIHKVIRVITYDLFGLPTFAVMISVLNENEMFDTAKNRFMVGTLLGEFFRRNPSLRSQETIQRSSMFHGGYMSCIIAFGYCCFGYAVERQIDWSLGALACFVVFIACMWADHKFGDNEESIALQLNKRRLTEFVRRMRDV